MSTGRRVITQERALKITENRAGSQKLPPVVIPAKDWSDRKVVVVLYAVVLGLPESCMAGPFGFGLELSCGRLTPK